MARDGSHNPNIAQPVGARALVAAQEAQAICAESHVDGNAYGIM